jgi:hypothetical protein
MGCNLYHFYYLGFVVLALVRLHLLVVRVVVA